MYIWASKIAVLAVFRWISENIYFIFYSFDLFLAFVFLLPSQLWLHLASIPLFRIQYVLLVVEPFEILRSFDGLIITNIMSKGRLLIQLLQKEKHTRRQTQEMKTIIMIISICLALIAFKPNGIRDFLFISFIETCLVFKQTFLWGFDAIIWIQNFYFNYNENWKPNLALLWQFSHTFFHLLSSSSSSWQMNTISMFEGRLTTSSALCQHLPHAFPNSKMKIHGFNWCNFQYNKIQYLHRTKIIICVT